jgi:hypothetical protein
LNHSIQGAAFTPYLRLQTPKYDNGFSAPICKLSSLFKFVYLSDISASMHRVRPSAREASRLLLSSNAEVEGDSNALLMQWGQFTAHDIAKTTSLPSGDCSSCGDIRGRCFNIELTRHDPT